MSEFSQIGGDILTKMFYNYLGENLANTGRTFKKGKSASVKRGARYATKFKGASISGKSTDLATKAYVKKAIETHTVGCEVTKNATSYQTGHLYEYSLGKNIDKGNDSGDRQKNVITLLGFRFFGSMRNASPVSHPPITCRFVIAIDKTPARLVREAVFTTISDSAHPVDFVDGTTSAIINRVRPINKDRYTVLYDWCEQVGSSSDSNRINSYTTTWNRYFKLNKKLHYNANYATSDAEITPHIRMMWWPLSDDGTSTANALAVNFQFEEHFSSG